MPSETFKNLSLEKQQSILTAAKKEFSSVSFHDASINKIIKDAGISRGSFYMYFKDKEDLYLAITLNEVVKIYDKTMIILEKQKGDLFNTYKELYIVFHDSFIEKENTNLIRNVVLNLNFKSETLLLKGNKSHQKFVDRFLEALDISGLDIKDKEELFDIVDMLNLLLIHSLVLSTKKRDMEPEVRNRYFRQLQVIKQGVKKGK